MKNLGYNQPLYILPFDHRGSFETKMFGWHGDLTLAQRIVPELKSKTMPKLKHDSSTNNLIRRYRQFKARA